jgi:hypothetical protein
VAPGLRCNDTVDQHRGDFRSGIDVKLLWENWSEDACEPERNSFCETRFIPLAADNARPKYCERSKTNESYIPFGLTLGPADKRTTEFADAPIAETRAKVSAPSW